MALAAMQGLGFRVLRFRVLGSRVLGFSLYMSVYL